MWHFVGWFCAQSGKEKMLVNLNKHWIMVFSSLVLNFIKQLEVELWFYWI